MNPELFYTEPCHHDHCHAAAMGKKERVQSLYGEILQHISANRFDDADRLRVQLFNLDKRAVHEIYESGRILEKARQAYSSMDDTDGEASEIPSTDDFKQADRTLTGDSDSRHSDSSCSGLPARSFSSPHLSTVSSPKGFKPVVFSAHWFHFINHLTIEELSNAVEFLKIIRFDSMQSVLKKGALNNRLFFIEKGKVSLSGAKEMHMNSVHLAAGDIFGGHSFFSQTQNPYSAIAYQKTEVMYLEREDLVSLEAVHPDIMKTIHALCVSINQAEEGGRKYLLPRYSRRFDVTGKIRAQLLNHDGNKLGKSIKGTLVNLSQGGYAFHARVENEEFLDGLIGEYVNSVLDVAMDVPKKDILWRGRIVDINNIGGKMHSVHVCGHYQNRNVFNLVKKLEMTEGDTKKKRTPDTVESELKK